MDFAVTKNYSLKLAQISKVSDLAQRFGVSQGRVVREAIDRLYEAAQIGAVTVIESDDAGSATSDDVPAMDAQK